MLEGLVLIEPKRYEDERGFFLEAYQEKRYHDLGVRVSFCQDNHSFSKRGVIRGMHFQKGQAKLIYCPIGEIFDVVVDIRESSPTFGEWEGFHLSGTNGHQLFIPDGFAHGFCVLSKEAHLLYKVDQMYNPHLESGFRYDDATIGIDWPLLDPIVSSRDLASLSFQEIFREVHRG